MPTRTLTRSFAGGEIAPELAGRLDLVKYQTGVARARNFEVLPHGPMQNRAGFGYIIEVKFSNLRTILLPFIYNTEQAYELEFGDFYVRFHTQAGTVLNASQPITSMTVANPGVFTKNAHGYTNGMAVFLSNIVGPTALNNRFFKIAAAAANTFQLTDLAGNAISTVGMSAFVSGDIANVYEIASPYSEADVQMLKITQSNDVLTLTHPSYETRELRRMGGTNWQFAIIATTPTVAAPTGVSVVNTGGGAAEVHRYKVTAVSIASGQEESLASQPAVSTSTNITAVTQANPGVVTSVAHGRAVGDPVYISGVLGMTQLAGEYYINTVVDPDNVTLKTLDGNVVDTTAYSAYTSGGSLGYAAVKADLGAGDKNKITYTAVAGASRYNAYKWRSGLWAYIGQAAHNEFIDDNIQPDVSQTPPEINNPFGTTNNYPRAVGYYQGRRWFGGSVLKPLTLFATRSGTESNMTNSIPTRENDSINVNLTARQANTIRHIVPLSDLILLTSGAEWRVNAGNDTTITPLNIDYKPQGYIGASEVMPVVTADAVLYAADRGGRVREMLYSWEKSGYKSSDISIMAPHLFDGYTIVSMAYVRAPHPIIYCVRSDGILLGLTHVPEHQVAAWHWIDTDGAVKWVCAVPEGVEDVLYAVIQRTINGRTVQYIERKHTRQFTALEDAFFVDAGVTYDGAPTTTITGLWHLEGKEVAILADGAVMPRQTVANGRITLIVEASVVHIGIPYTADLYTLPLSFEGAAFGQGKPKNINAVYTRVVNSSGVKVGPLGGTLRPWKQRTTEPYGSPPRMVSGEHKLVVEPSWSADAQVHLQQENPLPVTVLSMTLEAAVGGN